MLNDVTSQVKFDITTRFIMFPILKITNKGDIRPLKTSPPCLIFKEGFISDLAKIFLGNNFES